MTTTPIRKSAIPLLRPARPGRLLADFEVLGVKPVPYAWGPGGYRNGREARAGIPNIPLHEYQTAIREAAWKARLDPYVYTGPIEIVIVFSDLAPVGVSDGNWWLKPLVRNEITGRFAPATQTEGDTTNFQKTCEDALQGILFANDVQVVRVASEKRWSSWQGVHVTVREASSAQ